MKIKQAKGITLIALVITIVILLILAGISISTLTNTGIFGKVKEAKEKGFEVVTDSGAIEKIVDEVIQNNPKAIEDFKKGKTNVVGWVMGQVMKASQGKANPGEATKLINQKLSTL